MKKQFRFSYELHKFSISLLGFVSFAEELVVIEIVMGDEPGTLARLAKTLSDLGVDLVSSESRSTSRGKAAAWRVVCNASSVRDKNELKRRLEKSGAKTVRFQKA